MSDAHASADRYKVVKTLDRQRDELTQAALALSKAYSAYLEGAANAPVPPKQVPRTVTEALARYRREVAKAKGSIKDVDKGLPDRAKALEALAALDAGLKGMQAGANPDYKKAAEGAERGREKMKRYFTLSKRLRVPDRKSS